MSDKAKGKKGTLFLVDGTSCLYRAYHAIPHLTNTKGVPTGAVYGFTQTLRKIMKDYSPDFIGIAFDVRGPTFRHELFDEYKIERPSMPDDLSVQIDYIKELVRVFNIPVLEKQGFEADDVLATFTRRFEGEVSKVVIVTSDKDMYQLVTPAVSILDTAKDREFDAAGVKEKFGVDPSQIRDLLSLAGDKSDGIPGVPGVGMKTAAKLLTEYGDFDGVFENRERVSGKKLKANLVEFREQAEMSRELATLREDVDIECTLEDLKSVEPDFEAMEVLLSDLEFTRLIKELIPRESAAALDVNRVENKEAAQALAAELAKAGAFSVVIERAKAKRGEEGQLRGVAFLAGTGGAKGAAPHFVPEEALDCALVALRPVFENAKIEKQTHDVKGLHLLLLKRGVSLEGVTMDTSLASYLLNPSRFAHTLENVSYAYIEERLDGEEGGERGGADVTVVAALSPVLEKELRAAELLGLLIEMELPLSRVLAEMEFEGVEVESAKLAALSKEMEGVLGGLEGELYKAAGCEFNINSPKQLSKVLFEDLGLKPIKKTKTGFSTNESVLTQLASDHEVPGLIISYRQMSKLKSTYVDAIPPLVDPATGRLHTSFNQTVAATGRLSSSRPNLQNIPVRSEYSKRIRAAFVAKEGFTFFAADYSQVELRLVAHYSEDPVLVDSFKKGEDVHTRTAAEVFGVDAEEVTKELRRRAKAINFGIIYGMGPFGLAAEIDVSMAEARDYIESYFDHYRSVRDFIDETISVAEEKGYTTTLFGRRRYIPELAGYGEAQRRLGERLAVNTPIQGSAADIIKAAMIEIQSTLKTEGFASRMLLQIHDELLFEVARGEEDRLREMVVAEMEGVADLCVPLVVNVKTGRDWGEVG